MLKEREKIFIEISFGKIVVTVITKGKCLLN